MKTIDAILFATDFSEVSEYAFDYAATLAATCGARLVVIHVVPHQVDLRSLYVPDVSFDELDQQVEEGAKNRMADFCGKVAERFPDVAACVVTGIPHEEIIRKAAEEKASLIVMGTHGRRGFDHFIFGSTAERVVKTSSCPVLTVRPVPA